LGRAQITKGLADTLKVGAKNGICPIERVMWEDWAKGRRSLGTKEMGGKPRITKGLWGLSISKKRKRGNTRVKTRTVKGGGLRGGTRGGIRGGRGDRVRSSIGWGKGGIRLVAEEESPYHIIRKLLQERGIQRSKKKTRFEKKKVYHNIWWEKERRN